MRVTITVAHSNEIENSQFLGNDKLPSVMVQRGKEQVDFN